MPTHKIKLIILAGILLLLAGAMTGCSSIELNVKFIEVTVNEGVK